MGGAFDSVHALQPFGLLGDQQKTVQQAVYAAHFVDLLIKGQKLAPAAVYRKARKFPAYRARKVYQRPNVPKLELWEVFLARRAR